MKKLLWVEDREQQVKHFVFLLRKRGYDVELCETGEDALEAILASELTEPYDVVLLDIMLPKGEGSRIDPSTRPELMGEEVLDQMKSQGVSTPVVCVTCVADDRLIKRLRTEYSFVKEVLKKPVTIVELERAIDCALGVTSGHSQASADEARSGEG